MKTPERYIGGTGDFTRITPEQDQTKPWGKRERIIPLKTYSGKIVYEKSAKRKKKFTARDIKRISGQLEAPEGTPDAIVDYFTDLAIEFLLDLIVEKVLVLAVSMTPVGKIAGTLSTIIDLFLTATNPELIEIRGELGPLLSKLALVASYELKSRE